MSTVKSLAGAWPTRSVCPSPQAWPLLRGTAVPQTRVLKVGVRPVASVVLSYRGTPQSHRRMCSCDGALLRGEGVSDLAQSLAPCVRKRSIPGSAWAWRARDTSRDRIYGAISGGGSSSLAVQGGASISEGLACSLRQRQSDAEPSSLLREI